MTCYTTTSRNEIYNLPLVQYYILYIPFDYFVDEIKVKIIVKFIKQSNGETKFV